MLLELDIQRGGGSADRSQIFDVHIVGAVVGAFGSQRDLTTLLRGVEGVVHFAIFARTCLHTLIMHDQDWKAG